MSASTSTRTPGAEADTSATTGRASPANAATTAPPSRTSVRRGSLVSSHAHFPAGTGDSPITVS
ncbi:hypothetical protein GCM10010470_56660 [Saccharopolyspora taberi]|uniref:Uncharacterized protein n=1 Tax=Saccharopolyspora taberi TaxID=60895 RepID=A0ABN3VKG4_9PSEU